MVACGRPQPPPRPVIAASEPATCTSARLVACDCRAGKGYRRCEAGELTDCICHRGQQAGLSDRDVKPPTIAELMAYTRDLPGTGALRAELETNFGIIDCELFSEDAPLAVANFVGLARGLKAWRDPATGALARRPYYDGLTFHRVRRDFIVQGGDPRGDGTGGPGYVFADELSNGHSHDRPGVLAMANRKAPNTNGSQFYIMMKPAPRLDALNTVFGQCDDLAVLSVINRVPVFDNDRPRTPVTIERVRIHRSAF